MHPNLPSRAPPISARLSRTVATRHSRPMQPAGPPASRPACAGARPRSCRGARQTTWQRRRRNGANFKTHETRPPKTPTENRKTTHPLPPRPYPAESGVPRSKKVCVAAVPVRALVSEQSAQHVQPATGRQRQRTTSTISPTSANHSCLLLLQLLAHRPLPRRAAAAPRTLSDQPSPGGRLEPAAWQTGVRALARPGLPPTAPKFHQHIFRIFSHVRRLPAQPPRLRPGPLIGRSACAQLRYPHHGQHRPGARGALDIASSSSRGWSGSQDCVPHSCIGAGRGCRPDTAGCRTVPYCGVAAAALCVGRGRGQHLRPARALSMSTCPRHRNSKFLPVSSRACSAPHPHPHPPPPPFPSLPIQTISPTTLCPTRLPSPANRRLGPRPFPLRQPPPEPQSLPQMLLSMLLPMLPARQEASRRR